MAAYCVGQIRIKDAAIWEQYRNRVGETITRHGGEVLFRGGIEQAFSGDGGHDSVVALRFDDLAAAKRWHASPEYQALIPLRDRGAEVLLILYQG